MCRILSVITLTDASPITIFPIPNVSIIGVRQVVTEGFIECEQWQFPAFRSLPCSLRAAGRTDGWIELVVQNTADQRTAYMEQLM